MKIRLVSKDRHVEGLCREGLARLCGTDWSLYLDPDGRLNKAVDLSILDLDAFAPPHSDWERPNGAAHILLCSQERMPELQGALPAATILLKPLQRELFMTVLSCAVERRGSCEKPVNGGAEATMSREQSDELLQCLLHTNLELQRFHARQMNFLARGLHDLRAPLTAIEGYSGLLLAERFGPLNAAQCENLRRMQHSIARLSRMATDIFRLSLGQRGKQDPDLQPGDLGRHVQQALQEVMPLADARSIRIVEEVAAPADQICFDAAQIESVLANLLENACRFTPRQGSIEVRGYSVFWDRRRPEVSETVPRERRNRDSRRPNAYRVDIHDCGPGVPAEHLSSIFEPYTSYAGSRDRAGSGLGLAICRMVVSAHRGQIFATSSEEGAVFSFVLPFAENGARLAPQPPQTDQASPADPWPVAVGGLAEGTAIRSCECNDQSSPIVI